ncbi:MAG: M48 family metalloprotease [Microbacteriaceae bacterium]
MYSAIARNKRTTVILIVAYIFIVTGVGVALSWVFGSVWPAIILGVVSIVHVVLTWFYGGRWVEAALHSHRVSAKDEPRFYRTIENLAIRNGMPIPALGVEEVSDINAYAMGLRRDRAVVGVTRGALDNLDNVELEAILSHEMAHIRNGDSRVKVLVMGLVGAMQLIAIILIGAGAQTANQANARRDNRDNGGAAVVGGFFLVLGLVFLIIGYVVGPIVQSAVSRQREYLADASGVEMTRFAPGMISMFRKLELSESGAISSGANGAMGMFYAYRRRRRGLGYLFTASHPPTWKRIERIQAIAKAP